MARNPTYDDEALHIYIDGNNDEMYASRFDSRSVTDPDTHQSRSGTTFQQSMSR